MNGMANVIGGLIGYSIGHIHDKLPTYKFPFVIFGSATIAWGVVFTFLTPANPTQAKWLTQREKTIAVLRLAENETGIDNKKFKMYQLREALTDLRCWLMILIMLANCIPNVSLNPHFSVSITHDWFSGRRQCLWTTYRERFWLLDI